MAKKKVVRKAQPRSKVPGMKDVLAAHNMVERKRRISDQAKDQASARKKEYEGAQADLSSLLREIKAGQTRMDF